MKLRYVAPAILLLASGCSSDLTTAAGPSAAESPKEQMEREGSDTWPPPSRFRRPSYPKRDT